MSEEWVDSDLYYYIARGRVCEQCYHPLGYADSLACKDPEFRDGLRFRHGFCHRAFADHGLPVRVLFLDDEDLQYNSTCNVFLPPFSMKDELVLYRRTQATWLRPMTQEERALLRLDKTLEHMFSASTRVALGPCALAHRENVEVCADALDEGASITQLYDIYFKGCTHHNIWASIPLALPSDLRTNGTRV
jgi:hypothetical protein